MNGKETMYIPARKMCQIIGLKYPSAKSFAEKAGFKTLTTPSGQVLYNRQSIEDYINNNTNIPEISKNKEGFRKIVYCRVSSKKQEDDLQRQIELARSSFPNHEIFSDVGSGINFRRKSLNTILELAMQKSLSELVVFHKDRLARFGFELIEKIINLSGGKIIVVDHDAGKSSEQELAEDLLSIVHVYSCRQVGKRRYSRKQNDIENKKNQVISESETEDITS
jgi:predicted site-specific integrase-resolvase